MPRRKKAFNEVAERLREVMKRPYPRVIEMMATIGAEVVKVKQEYPELFPNEPKKED